MDDLTKNAETRQNKTRQDLTRLILFTRSLSLTHSVAVFIFVFGENVGEENVDVGRVLDDGRPVDSAVVGENVGRNVGVLDGRSVDSTVVGENVGRNVGVSDGRSVASAVVVVLTNDGNSTISGIFNVGRSVSISISFSFSSAGRPEEESRVALASAVGENVGRNVGVSDGRSVDSVGRNVGKNVGVSDGRPVDSAVVVTGAIPKDGNSTISGMFTVGRSVSISISFSSAGRP